MKHLLFAVCCLYLVQGDVPLGAAENQPAPPIRFKEQIAPILVEKCLTCHGPEKARGRYQLQTFELLFKPGDSESRPVVPGDPGASELFRLVTSGDAEDRMPQKADPLTGAEVTLIRRWIEEGAVFDGPDRQAPLASLLPIRPHPAPPLRHRFPVPVLALAFHPAGAELAVGGYHEITLWNPADGTFLKQLTNVTQRTHSLMFSPDGNWLAAAGGIPGRQGEVKLFDLQHDQHAVLFTGADVVLAAAFSPDGSRLAAAGTDNSIRIFDVAKRKEMLLIQQHADWVSAVVFSPDGTHLASASRDRSARIYNARTGELELSYPGHGAAVNAVAFGPGGREVLSAGRDRKIHLWSMAEGKKTSEFTGFEEEIYQVLASGEFVFSSGADRVVRQFQLEKGKLARSFSGHADRVYALAYHAPTLRLASGSYDGEVRIWDVTGGATLSRWTPAR
jgi:hypothetical protein